MQGEQQREQIPLDSSDSYTDDDSDQAEAAKHRMEWYQPQDEGLPDQEDHNAQLLEALVRKHLDDKIFEQLLQHGITSTSSLPMLKLSYFQDLQRLTEHSQQEQEVKELCYLDECRDIDYIHQMHSIKNIPSAIEEAMALNKDYLPSKEDKLKAKEILAELKNSEAGDQVQASSKEALARILRMAGCTPFDFDRLLKHTGHDPKMNQMADFVAASMQHKQAYQAVDFAKILEQGPHLGVFYSPRNLKETLAPRSPSVKIVKDLQSFMSSHCFKVKEVFAMSHSKLEEPLLKVLRFGNLLQPDLSHKFLNLDISSSYSTSGPFYQMIRFAYHPTQEILVNQKDIELSTDAIAMLKAVHAKLRNNQPAEMEVQQYFQKFGSHVCTGPIVLGGVCAIVAEVKSTADPDEVKRVLQQELRKKAEAIGMVMKSDNQAVQPHENEAIAKDVTVKFHSSGGPRNEQDMISWNIKLHQSSKDWQIIDQGNSFVPVWRVVMQHHDSFHNTIRELANYLHMQWKKLTGQAAFTDLSLSDAQESYNALQNKVQEYFAQIGAEISSLEDEEFVKQEVESILTELLLLKKDYSVKLKSILAWKEYVDTSDLMKRLLLLVLKWMKGKNFHMVSNLLISLVPSAAPPLNFQLEEQKLFEDEVTKKVTEDDDAILKNDFLGYIDNLILLKERDPATFQRGACQYMTQLRDVSTAYKMKANFYPEKTRYKSIQFQTLFRMICISVLDFDPIQSQVLHKVQDHMLRQVREKLNRHMNDFGVILDQNPQPKDNLAQAYLMYCAIQLSEGIDHKFRYLLERVMESFNWKNFFRHDPFLFKNIPSDIYEYCFMKIDDSAIVQRLAQQKDRVFNFKTDFQKQFKIIKNRPRGQHQPAHQVDQATRDALRLLNIPSEIKTRTAKQIYSDIFYESKINEATDETMIRTESERPMAIFRQILMKNPESLKLVSQENKNGSILEGVHGLDILVSLMIASEPSVREIMVSNLMTCQLATPLLLPTLEMVVYPYLNRTKSWKYFGDDQQERAKSESIFTHKGPIVSFIRACDDCSVNKSKLINSLFSDEMSPAFLNINHTSTYPDKQAARGLIEMIQYCPEYEKAQENQINDMVTILNLRGNVHNHPQQLQFIKEHSDLIVVVANRLVDFQQTVFVLKEKDDRNFLWVGSSNDAANKPIGKNVINARFKQLDSEGNEFQIGEIKAHIANYISEPANVKCKSLQEISEGLKNSDQFKLDMNSPILRSAKGLADTFQNHCQNTSKKNVLPLQGEDLWGKITQLEKQFNRISSEKCSFQQVIKQSNNIKKQIKEKRQEQLKIACRLNPVIIYFIEVICNHDAQTTFYFIEFVISYLNQRSKKELTLLRNQYSAAIKDYRVLAEKKIKDIPDLVAQKERKLDQVKRLGEQIQKKSFGFEHLIRECSQIYEAMSTRSQNPDDVINLLPKKIAEQLLLGTAIEMMDGENSFIPDGWINAIMKQLDQLSGNSMINVQSIVGQQSSGKSTFLNAQYNSKFAVAAERCTKGIYLHILEVSDEVKRKFNLGSSFIINLDTEGLRSPELKGNREMSLNHDNEMATLILSIADYTVLNIDRQGFGQIQDILNIAVHAILKIRQACGTKPQLKIVHQNERVNNPEECYQNAIAQTQLSLDEETRRTAKLLKMESLVQHFADVIPTDQDRDFVKPLFVSQKENSAFSTEYLKKAHAIKKNMLAKFTSIEQSRKSSRQTFETFGQKISQLWQCLLKENFAFAYQNNSEIAAKMESQTILMKTINEIDSKVEQLRQSISREIKSGQNYNQNEILAKVKSLQQMMIIQYREQIREITENSKEQVSRFSDEMMRQVEQSIIQSCSNTKLQLLDLYQEFKYTNRIREQVVLEQQQMKELIYIFYQQHKTSIDQHKGNVQAQEHIFRIDFWQPYKELHTFNQQRPQQRVFPWDDFRNFLQDQFLPQLQGEIHVLDQSKLNLYRLQAPISIDPESITDLKYYFWIKTTSYIDYAWEQVLYWMNVGNTRHFAKFKGAIRESNELQKQIKKMAHTHISTHGEYRRQTFEKDIIRVYDMVNRCSEMLSMDKIYFTQAYYFKCIVRYAAYVLPAYEAKIQSQLDEQDPNIMIEKMLYPTLRDLFLTLCQDLTHQDTQVQLVSKIMGQLIEEQLKKIDTCRIFRAKFLNEEPEFLNKGVLVKNIMHRILDGDFDFEQIQEYNQSFDSYLLNYIKERVKETASKPETKQWFRDFKDSTFELVKNQVRDSFRGEQTCLREILQSMESDLLARNNNNETNVVLMRVSDFETCDLKLEFTNSELKTKFAEKVIEQLQRLQEQCVIDFTEEFQNDMIVKIKDDRIGCTQQCNCCGVVCDLQKDHKSKCYSQNHKYPALIGYRNTRTDGLTIDYNCNGIYARGDTLNYRPFEEVVCQTWTVEKSDLENIEKSQNMFYQWMIAKYKDDYLERYDLEIFHPQDPNAMWGSTESLETEARRYVERYYA